jgi:RNA polymerase sigma factor (TIGR02999 family)
MAAGTGTGGEQLLLFLYHETRALARRHMAGERPNHTLTTTALVNELYLRLAGKGQRFATEGEFIRAASRIMRNILVDYARTRNRAKRGGEQETLPLSEVCFDVADGRSMGLEALDEALTCLARTSERLALVVEMRFFGGLSAEEIAAELKVSSRTVKRDWVVARSWLREWLDARAPGGVLERS